MVEKIEEIYNFSVDKMIRQQNYAQCADCVNDYLWHKYQKNTVYFHQALINLLYSLKKLSDGNEDVVFFDNMLTEEFNFNQFVSFLLFREIFQTITKITIIDHDKLKVDPTRILINREVALEMVSIFYRDNARDMEQARQQTAEFFGGHENLPYYTLMDFLIKLTFCLAGDQVKNLRGIFQPEAQKEWDYNIGFPKDKKDPRENKFRPVKVSGFSPGKDGGGSPQSWKGGRGVDTNDPYSRGAGGNRPFGQNDQNRPGYDSEGDEYKLRSPDNQNGEGGAGGQGRPGGQGPGNQGTSGGPGGQPGGRSGDENNQGGQGKGTRSGRGTFDRDGGAISDIYPEYFHTSGQARGPLDTDLNLLLRRRMSALIGK